MRTIDKNIISLFIFVILFQGTLAAQTGSIEGRILEYRTGKPLQEVNVYIANSSMGSSTNKNGRFKISNIPKGKYNLIISRIGYERIVKSIRITGAKTLHFKFKLRQQIYRLPTVVVDEDEMRLWKERLKIFKREFLGMSSNAEECRIENEYVISFEEKDGKLFAKAGEPLKITNNSLGYKLDYYLEYFMHSFPNTFYKGMPVFHEIQTDDKDLKASWNEARLRTYCGSLRHFLYAISKEFEELKDTVNAKDEKRISVPERQGFGIYHLKYIEAREKYAYSGLDVRDFVFPSSNDYENIISFNDLLEVVYSRKKEDPNYMEFLYENRWPEYPVAQIYLQSDSVHFDKLGRYYDEFQIQTLGYWAFLRVADMLPFDYSVPDTTLEKIKFKD